MEHKLKKVRIFDQKIIEVANMFVIRACSGQTISSQLQEIIS